MSNIEHIRSTLGFPYGDWPKTGMSSDANLRDLEIHAADFALRRGFTFTVLDPVKEQVIGCLYLHPSKAPEYEVVAPTRFRCGE